MYYNIIHFIKVEMRRLPIRPFLKKMNQKIHTPCLK